MFKQFLKKIVIVLIGSSFLIQKFYAVTPLITITNPEKLNYITEQSQLSLNSGPSPATDIFIKHNDEISNIDLDLSTELLFSDEEFIPIYSAPQHQALCIGKIIPPGEVWVIRLCGDFAKIKICDNQAGWILRRNIQTSVFNKKYQERFDRLLGCSPINGPPEEIGPVSPNNEVISISPSSAETITDNLEEEPEDEKKQ